ncbi:hypothetical protein N7E81_18950 [Reichenbachiella carrageenanivorans]|uniref:Uncharacterized protein n=1 Tax=Reichenbachiella carrageenanivorans TaxID=2979869 RepID=A0ABY6CZV4_9BACT|nr:hypothetical protein [Reichenbachiella carrageenanivorans]UXX79432.1 hypothetical protein N7E81_18950 [Reichenbachiella carrageenanivorans]
MFSIDDDKKWGQFIKLMVGGFVVFGAIFIIGNVWMDDQYPNIKTTDEIEGKVTSIKPYQSASLVELNSDGNTFAILGARNYKYDPYDLNYFLKEGDYLQKNMNSDTLMIKRDGKEYVFVIGGYLNKELRKD